MILGQQRSTHKIELWETIAHWTEIDINRVPKFFQRRDIFMAFLKEIDTTASTLCLGGKVTYTKKFIYWLFSRRRPLLHAIFSFSATIFAQKKACLVCVWCPGFSLSYSIPPPTPKSSQEVLVDTMMNFLWVFPYWCKMLQKPYYILAIELKSSIATKRSECQKCRVFQRTAMSKTLLSILCDELTFSLNYWTSSLMGASWSNAANGSLITAACLWSQCFLFKFPSL